MVVTGRSPDKIASLRQDDPALTVERVDASSVGALSEFYHLVGPFDGVVLSVSGANGAGPFSELDGAEVLGDSRKSFFAQFRAAQTALPFLRKDHSLTFITAISAQAANPGTAGLAAINGAIEAMVKPLSKELRPLRVTAISPGVVETPWWDRLPSQYQRFVTSTISHCIDD